MKLDTLRQAAGGTLVLHFHKKMLKMIIDYRKAIMVVLPVIFLFIAAGSLRAQDNLTYDYLIELGKDNLREHKYGEALHYFELAQAADPAQSDDCLFYINLVKRLREGKVAGIGLEDYGKKVKKMPFKKKLVKKALDRMEGKLRKKGEEKTTAGEKEKIVAETAKETGKPVRPEAKKSGASLLLTDELWQAESKPVVEMDIGQSLAIEGRNIKRFLVIDPTIVEAARLAPDKINLTPKRAGTTFIHVWDDKGRCTLPVKVLFYSRSSKEGGAAKEKEPELETRAEPFRVNYAVNRQIRYDGNTTPNFSLRSADFTQAASLWGSTPYGDLDFTADIRQFAKAVTLKDYSAGMTNANFGPMRHFNVRWANISPPLSSYSGGGSLRGVLLDDNFFNDKLGYTLFWGRDSGSYGGTLTPGVSPADKNYIEGGKLAFSPFDNHKFNLSLVKGYGQRSVDAADHVFTLLTNDSFGSTSVNSEIGFDGNKYAFNVGSSFPLNGVNLNLNIRHVNQSYSTVTGQAGGRGTSQAQAGMSTSIAKIISLSSSFAVQKDELDRNPGKPHKLNLQSDTGIGFPVGLRGNWQTNVSWSANPGNSFPRRQLRINNTYSRSFKFAGRDLALSLGENFQRVRTTFSSSSDYDQNDYPLSLNIPLLKTISGRISFQYYERRDVTTGQIARPWATTYGLNYNNAWGKLSANAGFSYRNEQNAAKDNSPIPGEDSIAANGGINYRLFNIIDCFVNARIRNVHAKNPNQTSYKETDISMGINSSLGSGWAIPLFRWDPRGVIRGVVFKDLDGDRKQSSNEPGMAGIKIKVGKRETVTDEDGAYRMVVRAKKVIVAVDMKSVPPGYVFSTSTIQEVEVLNGAGRRVDFGANTQSGIYGVVFYDKDSNGRPDSGEEYIHGVKIILDKKTITATDSTGAFFFRNIKPGTHSLRIDIGSLPLSYLPKVPIIQEITLAEGTTYTCYIPMRKDSD